MSGKKIWNNVVITGASGGLGREFVKYYQSQGSRVWAFDVNEVGLASLKDHYPQAETALVDVANLEEFRHTTNQLTSQFGQPDLWINNAGIVKLGPHNEVATEDFVNVMNVNLMGVVHGTQIALSLMQEPERGSIVNIASAAGVVAAPYMSSYVSSKHAIIGYTRSLQEELELSHSAIKMILVIPGFVRTAIMEKQNGYEFPRALSSLIENPTAVIKEIVIGIDKGKSEIVPTRVGKALTLMNRLAPVLTRKSGRLLVAKNWKEFFGFEPIK